MTGISINSKGVCIPKKDLTPQEIFKIKKDLNVSPENSFGNFAVKSFKVYKQTDEHYILPIYYFLSEFKDKAYSVCFENCNEDVSIPNSIELRQSQEECYKKCIEEYKKPFGGGVIALSTGQGKCLAYDTEVLMYDGAIKKVQDIKPGEVLMGDDSTPRNVLTTTSGKEEMFEIISEDGKYTVNKSHILSLKNTVYYCEEGEKYSVNWFCPKKKKYTKVEFNKKNVNLSLVKSYKKHIEEVHDIVDISVKDYNKLKTSTKVLLNGYRVKVEFSDKNTSFDHYCMGQSICDTGLTSRYFNSIPYEYKCNSREKRLSLLAGIIDSIGIYNAKDECYIIRKSLRISDEFFKDIKFLCRSLGFCVKLYIINDQALFKIYGDNLYTIPVRYDYKKAPVLQSTIDHLVHGITVVSKGVGDYYGFEIDGNKRFILGDFTVTHNTVLSLKMISNSSKKTLIVVNKIELMKQWEKEILKWFGDDIKIGIIQGSKFEYKGYDIVIGMLQTISIKQTLTPEDFNWVDACYIDECHNISSEVFSNIMFKIRPRYLFGLTATIERKDKLEKIIKWYMGDILYDGRAKALKQSTQVHCFKYRGESSIEKHLRDGTAAVATMITNIAKDKERNDNIVKILKKLIDEDDKRCILVISDRIAQLKYINKCLGDEISGLFIGSMKSDAMEKSKEKRILLGTYALVNEGFNLPKLNCLLFATPRSSIIQAIGRIYRKEHEITPIIIDIYDEFSIFKGQYYRRRKIYTSSIKDCIILTKTFTDSAKVLTENKCLFDSDSESDNDSETLECLID